MADLEEDERPGGDGPEECVFIGDMTLRLHLGAAAGAGDGD